MTLPFLFIG